MSDELLPDGQMSVERLKSLIEINTRINKNYGDQSALLVSILESAKALVNCEAGSLLLVNREDESLYFYVALGPKVEFLNRVKVDKKSIAGWVCENKKSQIINDVNGDPRFNSDVQTKTGYFTRNMIAFPMMLDGECIGVIELLNKEGGDGFTERDLEILELMGTQAAVAYRNSTSFKSKQDQIQILQNTVDAGDGYHSFVAQSNVIKDIFQVVKNVARTNSSVLIIGESGVGKELFAEQVHLNSPRHKEPFVRLSCAALSPSLLESELFGHVKGAFTDAVSDQKGRFEMADKGTLFLDEIGELPLALQAKLLRVIQERKFERVGSSETISVDVRIIAATNRNLEKMVEEGTFRGDLYYRLNVFPLNIPPLRERAEDILPLSELFLLKFSKETKKQFLGFSPEAQKSLLHYCWPGNVRELENIVERACILGQGPLIQVKDLHLPYTEEAQPKEENTELVTDAVSSADKTLKTAVDSFKKEYIKRILIENGWNQTKAAKVLDVQRTYLTRLLKELDIRKN